MKNPHYKQLNRIIENLLNYYCVNLIENMRIFCIQNVTQNFKFFLSFVTEFKGSDFDDQCLARTCKYIIFKKKN